MLGPFVSAILVSQSLAQQPAAAPTDPSAPLRRFPLTMLVQRPDSDGTPVSILHVPSLHPKDVIKIKVDDKLDKDWTLVEATLAAGQKIQIQIFNLWEKKWETDPIQVGPLPDGDVVPLFFMVLNKRKERKVGDAIRSALETASEQIISQTATYEAIYQQQNRLLNFMTAYAAMGPKGWEPDPTYLSDRVYAINSDLGNGYDPTAPQTQPGDLQHGLDAANGAITALRESPDNPAPAAAVVRSQLPAVVSDWVALVGDLMHIFIKPPRVVKLTLIPASATELDNAAGAAAPANDDEMQLTTQRVLDNKGDNLPSMVYRPIYQPSWAPAPNPPLGFAKTEVMTGSSEVCVPLTPDSRALFLHPWAWDWEWSDDNITFSKLANPKLVPGKGLSFPISEQWWKGANERKVYIRAKVGFQTINPVAVRVVRVFPQHWAADPQAPPDLAVNDPAVAIRLARFGTSQPAFRFTEVSLTDSSGKAFRASGVEYDGVLVAKFNLNGTSPGPASVKVLQEGAPAPEAANVFIAPKRPEVSIYCGKGDKVLRVTGADAGWVKAVDVPSLSVQTTDDSDMGNRKLTLSGPLPPTVTTLEVTYHDKAHNLEWKHAEPVVVGKPRPKVAATLMGTLSSTVSIGSGNDPSWAVATLPTGWFGTKQPFRVQLGALAPFVWSHDISLEVGLGPSTDVQKVMTLQEGPSLAFDLANPNGIMTLDLASALPSDAKRNTGQIWVRVDRPDLASPWTPITLDAGSSPLRAIKLPTIQTVEFTATATKVTLADADQVLGVKFAGQEAAQTPQLVPGTQSSLLATADGPPNATEFDLQLRDAAEGVIHVKIVKMPAAKSLIGG